MYYIVTYKPKSAWLYTIYCINTCTICELYTCHFVVGRGAADSTLASQSDGPGSIPAGDKYFL